MNHTLHTTHGFLSLFSDWNQMKRQIGLLLLFVFIGGGVNGQTTRFVQNATDLENALTSGETNIQVKYGTYELTKTLVVGSSVTITGGYTALNARGGQTATTLKAPLGQRVITLDGGTVDGFIITGGEDDVAGGVCFRDGGTLKNCVVTKNTDTDGVGVGVGREGMSKSNKVQYCTIADNLKKTDFQYVTVKSIRWAKGNLKGTGTSAVIAAPTETGDITHMASLILYPILNLGTSTKPSAYSAVKWQDTEFTVSPGPNQSMNNKVPADNANDGVGDPCRFYLKDRWRMPDDTELKSIASFYDNKTKYYTEQSISGQNCILIPADLPDEKLYVRMTGFVNQAYQQTETNLCSWWWCSNWSYNSGGSYGRGLGFGFTGVSIYTIPEQIRYDDTYRAIKDGACIRCVYDTKTTK